MADVRKIDPERVKQDGHDIQKYGTQMYEALVAVQKLMKDSKGVYDEDSGDQLRSSFDTIAARFSEFQKLVDDYGKFLTNYADIQFDVDYRLKQSSTLG